MKYRAPFTLIKRGRYWYYRVYVGDCRKTLSTGQTAKSRAMERLTTRRALHFLLKPLLYSLFHRNSIFLQKQFSSCLRK